MKIRLLTRCYNIHPDTKHECFQCLKGANVAHPGCKPFPILRYRDKEVAFLDRLRDIAGAGFAAAGARGNGHGADARFKFRDGGLAVILRQRGSGRRIRKGQKRNAGNQVNGFIFFFEVFQFQHRQGSDRFGRIGCLLHEFEILRVNYRES